MIYLEIVDEKSQTDGINSIFIKNTKGEKLGMI